MQELQRKNEEIKRQTNEKHVEREWQKEEAQIEQEHLR